MFRERQRRRTQSSDYLSNSSFPLDKLVVVHLGFPIVADQTEHVGEESGVHADDRVQIDWQYVARANVT